MANELDTMSAYENTRPNASSYAVAETIRDVTGTINERSITFNGSLAGYDFEALLRQKQANINTYYELSDYFVDADDLVGGAIHDVYVPFSLIDGWMLTGGTEQTRAKYAEWFERIQLDSKLRSWFYQYYVFSNVYFSLMEDSDLVTLPPHLMRISNVLVGGNPLAEFNVRSLKTDLRPVSQKAWKKFIDDDEFKIRISGYPKEVTEAMTKNKEWVQLDPKTTWVWQGDKPEWQRYSIPMISRALIPLGHKALIRAQEDALLNLAAASFVHGAVGSPKDSNIVVDTPILSSIMAITKNAMKSGGGIAITNDCVKYEVIQPDLDHFYETNKYKDTNEAILGAFGINATVSSGSDNAVSFGTSQISTKLVSMRINAARQSMCRLMNRIMRAVNGSPYGLPRSNDSKLPRFEMSECDLTQIGAFQNACMKLWEAGVLSTKTLLDRYHIDMKTEYELKKQEIDDGKPEVFVKPGINQADTELTTIDDNNSTSGRPALDDSERQSDPGNSVTGRQPKPSNEAGSEAQE